MKRQIVTYSFVKGAAGAGTVTFSNFASIRLDAILLIENVTRGVTIYSAFDPAKLGTVSTNVLTLAFDTSTHSNADKLHIIYDDDDLDYDSGAGVAYRHASGLIVPASGGPVAITGDAANGLDVDVTRSVLPTGAATATLQGAGLPAALGAGGGLKVDGSGTALPVAHSDTAPATQNITAADAVSATASQQNAQGAVTGTPTAGSAATFALSGLDTVDPQITGTWVGTLVSEVSFDGGTTWFMRGFHLAGTTYTVGTITANAAGTTNVAGATHYRIRCTAYTSGTATVRISGSMNPSAFYLINSPQISDGTTPSQKLAISAAGAAKVDGSAVTQPVSIAAAVATTEDPVATSGGLTSHHKLSAASNNATRLVNGAARLYEVAAFNINAAARYIKFYNAIAGSSPAPATDTPVLVLLIPGNTTGAGLIFTSRHGRYFSTTLSYAIVTGISDTDNTSVAASEIILSIGYK